MIQVSVEPNTKIRGMIYMNTKEFYSLEEIQQYYDKRANTYIFKENNEEYINKIVFHFDLNVESSIDARDIKAHDIKAYNIYACRINASDIRAYNIYAYMISANNINSCDIGSNFICANNINASDISASEIIADTIIYNAVCYAYRHIKCKHIEGRFRLSQHFVLLGTLEVLEDE